VFLFSKLVSHGVAKQLRKDTNGRTVFLPFGPRKKAYFVDSKGDEEKIRSFLTMYGSASTLISWLATLAFYIFGWSSTSHVSALPLWTRLTPFLVSSSVYLLITLLWIWMLWSVYKDAVQGLTSSLREAGPEVSFQPTDNSFPQRAMLMCVLAGLVIPGLGIFVAVRYSPRRCPDKKNCTSWRSPITNNKRIASACSGRRLNT
jgi:hypothetical protein